MYSRPNMQTVDQIGSIETGKFMFPYIPIWKHERSVLIMRDDVLILFDSDEWRERMRFNSYFSDKNIKVPGDSSIYINRADIMRYLYYSKNPEAVRIRERFIDHDLTLQHDMARIRYEPQIDPTPEPPIVSSSDSQPQSEEQLIDEINRLKEQLYVAKARLTIWRADMSQKK